MTDALVLSINFLFRVYMYLVRSWLFGSRFGVGGVLIAVIVSTTSISTGTSISSGSSGGFGGFMACVLQGTVAGCVFDDTGGVGLDQAVGWVNRVWHGGTGSGLSGAVLVGVVRELDLAVAWR